MPAVFERAFRVRYDECDAYGHVNHANYLRYMQEAAFDASAAVGYDFATYDQLNRLWLVRETEITFLRALAYGDTVIVRTWVDDFRRVFSRRRYELLLQATGDPVATAATDWVLLDTATKQPTRISPQMVRAFMPEGQKKKPTKRAPFPQAPEPPPGIFATRRRVQWRDIDHALHVNNAVYLTYLEDCGIEFVRRKGWPIARMVAAGFGIVARKFRIEYKCPAQMDDELAVATWVTDRKRATAVRHYTIHRLADGQLLARARALWVWIDLASGLPIRIPQDFLADVSSNIA